MAYHARFWGVRESVVVAMVVVLGMVGRLALEGCCCWLRTVECCALRVRSFVRFRSSVSHWFKLVGSVCLIVTHRCRVKLHSRHNTATHSLARPHTEHTHTHRTTAVSTGVWYVVLLHHGFGCCCRLCRWSTGNVQGRCKDEGGREARGAICTRQLCKCRMHTQTHTHTLTYTRARKNNGTVHHGKRHYTDGG